MANSWGQKQLPGRQLVRDTADPWDHAAPCEAVPPRSFPSTNLDCVRNAYEKYQPTIPESEPVGRPASRRGVIARFGGCPYRWIPRRGFATYSWRSRDCLHPSTSSLPLPLTQG